MSKFSNPWCFENFIHTRAMKTAQDVRKRRSSQFSLASLIIVELIGIMDRYKHDLGEESGAAAFLLTATVSCGNNYNRVRMAICSGFFRNAAKKGKPFFIPMLTLTRLQILLRVLRRWSRVRLSASTRPALSFNVRPSGPSTTNSS